MATEEQDIERFELPVGDYKDEDDSAEPMTVVATTRKRCNLQVSAVRECSTCRRADATEQEFTTMLNCADVTTADLKNLRAKLGLTGEFEFCSVECWLGYLAAMFIEQHWMLHAVQDRLFRVTGRRFEIHEPTQNSTAALAAEEYRMRQRIRS